MKVPCLAKLRQTYLSSHLIMVSDSPDYVDLSDFHFQDGTEPTNFVECNFELIK